MSEFAITTVDIPRELDPEEDDDFSQAIALRNLVEELSFGTPDLAFDPAGEIALWQPSEFEEHRMLVARVDGRVVARGDYDTTIGADADTAWVSLQVHPEYRRRGIGSSLLTALEDIARAEGKYQVHVYAPVPLNAGPRIEAPTGFGSVPRDNPETQFLLAQGYTFEQVERVSRLELPVPGLHSLVDQAIGRCSRDYAVHEWVDFCPEQWRADLALLYTRMSTDEPSAGLAPPEDVWSVERLIEHEKRQSASGVACVYAAVEHVASGTLVGYTALTVPQDIARAIIQDNTIVLSEHRGHRLGMLLKVLNLAHVQRVAPGHPSVITFNVEENRHMLSVNEAVGFVPISHEGAWKRELS